MSETETKEQAEVGLEPEADTNELLVCLSNGQNVPCGDPRGFHELGEELQKARKRSQGMLVLAEGVFVASEVLALILEPEEGEDEDLAAAIQQLPEWDGGSFSLRKK